MLFKKSKINIALALLIISCNGFKIYSQNNSETSLYNWFDNVIGKENLVINNGTRHTNYDRTLNNKDRYYNTDLLTTGSINYDNQDYFEITLKYDIYKDELILKYYGESDYTEINLIKDKVGSFKINDENFINLNINNQLPSNSRGGYYEQNLVAKNFTFYIKHYKEKKEILKSNGVFIEYFYQNEFMLFIDNKFNIINTKKEILNLFPDYKSKINDYYLMNRNLKKENETKFMKNLMRYINSLQPELNK